MADTNLNEFQAVTYGGLGTFTFNVITANFYTISTISSEIPPSGLTVTINQNGTPIATSIALSSTQGFLQLRTTLSCAVSDVITVVISSSLPIDSLINNIKTIIDLHQGLV